MNRRSALRNLVSLAAASPLIAAPDGTVYPTSYAKEVMGPINLHEFEPIARQKLHKLAYDFIAGGVEDEQTLRGNREALERTFLVPRVMTDVTQVDTSVELLGKKMDWPIILAPTGGKNLVIRDGDMIAARGAAAVNCTYCVAGAPVDKLVDEGIKLDFWRNTIGSSTKSAAQSYARRCEDDGASAILVTVDNQYQSNRDRNNRNRFDYGYMSTGVPDSERAPRAPAVAAMWQPHTPNMTWEVMTWPKGAAKLPVIIKGVLHPEDAALCVQHGADALVVSNHGGRQLDGALPTIVALPDCVQAVGGKIPVLMDGGIRRGNDVVKALALGASAILIGRPYVWGLASFGQVGVQRVVELLRAELKLALALAGQSSLKSLNPAMVKRLNW